MGVIGGGEGGERSVGDYSGQAFYPCASRKMKRKGRRRKERSNGGEGRMEGRVSKGETKRRRRGGRRERGGGGCDDGV